MSRPKLGQLLLSENVCSRDALMHAWEQKVLFGDRLGTNLLAGGHVDEKTLALTLGRQHNTRAAYGEVLQPDPRTIRGLSRMIARRHNIVPHHRDDAGVYVLMQDPDDQAALEDAAAAFGAPILPVVVCEARMWTLLNTHYGVEMGLRPIDLDGAAATLKRIAATEGVTKENDIVADLVSEDEFHAMYMRQDEPVTSDAPDASDVPVAHGHSGDDTESVPTLEPEAGPNPPPGKLDDTPTDVFQLTESMEDSFADISAIHPPPPPQTDLAAPSLVDTDAPSDNRTAEVGDRRTGDRRAVARTESTPRIEYDATDAANAAVAAAAAAGEQLARPPTADEVMVAQTTAAATDSVLRKADDVVRTWLPLPAAPDVIFDDAAMDDALQVVARVGAQAAPSTSLFAAEDDDTPLTFEAATAALEHVRGRSEIARIVIRYALTRFKRAALMTVHPNNILGWEGIGEGISTARLSTFRMPRSEESVFALVAKTKAHYLGPLQRWPGNGKWVKHTGRQIPKTVAVFPVLVRGEVVNLFYGDNGHQENVEGDVGELLILKQKISSSYEALLGGSKSNVLGG